MSLQQQFLDHWQKKRFAPPGSVFLLSVSGGKDSMALARLFLDNRIPFAIGHCNFGLRPVDADLDEALVRDWAAAHKIPMHTVAFDTVQEMALRRTAVQETARALRYEWFDHLCSTEGYTAIVTAHHARDNAETLLMNLCKGTGMAGLHGIPERNGRIIRPLLFADREQISAYVAALHIPYREDASNSSDKYLRNAVRHHIIPALENLFPAAVQRLNESIQRFSQAELIYKKAIAQERKKLMEQRGPDWYIPVLKLRNRQPLETICYELFSEFGFTTAQVPHIITLLDSESGHYISSATHRIIRDRKFLILTAQKTEDTELLLIDSIPLSITTGHHKHFHFKATTRPESINTNPDVAALDLGKLEFPLLLRRRRTGDYCYPLGMGMKKKKVSKLLADLKMPLHLKEQVWILESNKRIVWVAGIRMDERFKVTENTTEVLLVTVTTGKP
jgi:tRNA(Ile)-lysidine synthase